MLKRTLLTGAFILSTGLAANANATLFLEVTVLSVKDSVVTVQARDNALPEWVQDGSQVQAAGWSSSIAAVSGGTFELHFQKSQASALHPNNKLLIRAEQEKSADGLTCG